MYKTGISHPDWSKKFATTNPFPAYQSIRKYQTVLTGIKQFFWTIQFRVIQIHPAAWSLVNLEITAINFRVENI
jgi:hypothetical protein